MTFRLLLSLLLLPLPAATLAAPAGKVDFSIGNVTAIAADGKIRNLAKGADIATGETVDTGTGRVQLRFSDGAQVSLQPQTQFRIDDYKYSGKGGEEEKGFFSLVKGGLRTITGLVGKKDRDNYRITTSVATIGIRGTEYTASLGDGLSVTTGEGSVEVCNAAGCLILNSGDSGFVPQGGGAPSRTETKTSLPPAPVAQAPTLKVEINQAEKPVAPVPQGLLSGTGYALALAANTSSGGTLRESSMPNPGTAEFAASGALVSFDQGKGNFAASPGTLVGALTDEEKIISWGAWTGGNFVMALNPTSTTYTHYVVGKPTPDADLLALQTNNMVGTYALIGYTLPTTSNGTVGQSGSVSGSMSANFGSGNMNGQLHVAVAGGTFHSNWYGSINGAGFSGSGYPVGGTCGDGTCQLGVQGFFAGANASRAGLTYRITGATSVGTILGAAAFKNTTMTQSVVVVGNGGPS